MEFEDDEVEVDLGFVELSDNGYEYHFKQGKKEKEVFIPGKQIDMFVVDYFYKIFAGSEYEKSDPDMDNKLYKEIRKKPFNGKEFSGYFSFMKKDFDMEMLKKLACDFAEKNNEATLNFYNGNDKDLFLYYDPDELPVNKYGIIENQKYTIECKSQMVYYDCIKLDAYLSIAFNKTNNPGKYNDFEKYYLSRMNIFVPE